jgi:hypothetical protein
MNSPNIVVCLVADPYQMNNLRDPAPELDALLRDWDAATPWSPA